MTSRVVYHGGKTSLLRYIMPLIEQAPEYTVYVEPFVGGGTVFFNLQHINKKGYILNDISNQVVNFYQVAKTYPDELITRLQAMPRSYTLWINARDELKKAKIIPNISLDHAVYFYYLYPLSHRNKGDSFSRESWGSANTTWLKSKKYLDNIIKALDIALIDCIDALEIIKRYDSEDSLFYIDPPYPNTAQGNYDGYTQEDFDDLLETLERVDGNFILSCYPKNIEIEYIKRNGWKHKFCKKFNLAKKQIEELLIYNFDLEQEFKFDFDKQ